MACDVWLPLLDAEADVLRPLAQDEMMRDLMPIRRDGHPGWWLHIIGRVTTEAQAIALVQLMIAEELAGHALSETPKQ